VASALLHVSGDIGRKVTRELRTLGPNLLVVPPTAEPAADEAGAAGPAEAVATFLDEALVRDRLARAGLDGVPLLYSIATLGGQRVTVIGAGLDAVRRLHPEWRLAPDAPGAAQDASTATALVGARLRERLGVAPGAALELRRPDGRSALRVTVAGVLTAGSAADEAIWVPLAAAQALAGVPGRVSLAQARVDGGAGVAAAVAATIEQGGGVRALVLHALSATEGRLLERMRRLMALVTIAALIAAGLCAFGTLTDLALERRREIALMKALGATPGDVVRLFAAESLAIGGLGGLAGWLLGVGFAELIGRQVFHSAVALRADVPLIVMALALTVAGLAGLGPIRLALAVEPAAALKGD
jgi:putative ABC transport system permease protein